MKLDILAFGAHPDDVELGCSGVLIKEVRNGKKVGIIDLTRGELGSRGTAEIRAQEAADAAQIIGCSIRENLELPDGFFEDNNANRAIVIQAIRKYQPDIIICNAIHDRHPDHGRGSNLLESSAFLSGLIKIETTENNIAQKPWRPRLVLHYLQDRWITLDVIVDISDVWEERMESIAAHRSQFFDPGSNEPETYISSKNFFEAIESRAREIGRPAQFKYAEGFTCSRTIAVKSLGELM